MSISELAVSGVAASKGLFSVQTLAANAISGNQVASGVATIALGTQDIVVPYANIAAGAVILLTKKAPTNPADEALSLFYTVQAGVSFTISTPANATAALPVAWFVADNGI